MSAAGHRHGAGDEHDRFRGAAGLVLGTVMLVRRAALARLVADAAGVTKGDRVADVGCGPGGAVREAARRGAYVTGVDPAPLMLRLGRYLTRGPLRELVTFRPGTAEQLPLPAESVSVAWSISSAHHWSDLPAGLREMYRVLAEGETGGTRPRQSAQLARINLVAAGVQQADMFAHKIVRVAVQFRRAPS